AVKNNIFGTEILARASLENNAGKFIFISTDKAVNPISVMGQTKRIGEMLCMALNQRGLTKFISVRFGNVLGSRGSVIPLFKEQIAKGGPVEVTHEEMKRYFMIIPEAVGLVLQAGQMGKGGEVFVLNMGDSVRIVDLARDVIKLSGLEPDKDVPIVFTDPKPGEKMFEEILTAEEGTTATSDEKIYTANLSCIEESKLAENLNKLAELVNGSNGEEIKNQLNLIIKNN
ncbi:MAG: polysaccharide biosynthesis protein, partial [bacterium]|nr:polysaccharide biosynthesis protein [bacterium]